MHFALGLLFVIIGIVIGARRTRPRWWTTSLIVLIAAGLVWAVLSMTGVTALMGYLATNTIGWIYVGLCTILMFMTFLVLERRGAGGSQDAIIGDTFLDGDADDADDAARTDAPARADASHTAGEAPAVPQNEAAEGADPDLRS